MNNLQYGRKQYSMKQYGKYKSESKPTPGTAQKVLMGKSRIKSVMKDKETSEWTTQASPIEVNKDINKFRVKDNLNDMVNSQTIEVNGEMVKVRLRTHNEIVMSESL